MYLDGAYTRDYTIDLYKHLTYSILKTHLWGKYQPTSPQSTTNINDAQRSDNWSTTNEYEKQFSIS